MINEAALADLLLRHHGANAEDASLAAGLILDEHERTHRPIADLVAASKSGFPSFYKKASPAPAAPAALGAKLSTAQQVAQAAKNGTPMPDDEVAAAIAKLRPRAF